MVVDGYWMVCWMVCWMVIGSFFEWLWIVHASVRGGRRHSRPSCGQSQLDSHRLASRRVQAALARRGLGLGLGLALGHLALGLARGDRLGLGAQ